MKNKWSSILKLLSPDNSGDSNGRVQYFFDKFYGHFLSVLHKEAIDINLKPIPWFTYPAIDFLNQFDFSNLSIFEWGAGNSSLYFASRAKSVLSVELEVGWAQELRGLSPGNLEIIVGNESSYLDFFENSERKFDLIIIDGHFRKECANCVIQMFQDGQLIILDNSDRHPDICKTFRDSGLTEIDFHGLGPINFYSWTTSIFFKTFPLKPFSEQPTIPPGGGY